MRLMVRVAMKPMMTLCVATVRMGNASSRPITIPCTAKVTSTCKKRRNKDTVKVLKPIWLD